MTPKDFEDNVQYGFEIKRIDSVSKETVICIRQSTIGEDGVCRSKIEFWTTDGVHIGDLNE